MHSEVNTVLPNFKEVHRLIPSHFPPIDLFEHVSDPDDLAMVFEIESLTNDRLKDEIGNLSLISVEDRISGMGSTPVMAAFTHISGLKPTRFTDNTKYGVYYGASDLDTAFAETIFHREKFLSATKEPDTDITMRDYINNIALKLHDITDDSFKHLHSEDYTHSQAFAKKLRTENSNGLLYNSVRQTGGRCIAIFKPKAVTIPVQGGHYTYRWCGKAQKVTHVIKLELVR
jgi:hypothetical protein